MNMILAENLLKIFLNILSVILKNSRIDKTPKSKNALIKIFFDKNIKKSNINKTTEVKILFIKLVLIIEIHNFFYSF